MLPRRSSSSRRRAAGLRTSTASGRSMAARSWPPTGCSTSAFSRSLPETARWHDRRRSMTEHSPGSTRSASYPTASSEEDHAHRVQLLTTEHWSLLATRSMSWNDALRLSSHFLSTLSAGVVALALAGPAMTFAGSFWLFALVILSVILFLG